MTTLELYRTAIAADDAFEAACKAAGFKSRWEWDGWEWDRQNIPAVDAAYRAKVAADDALHAAYAQLNEIRRAAHCLD